MLLKNFKLKNSGNISFLVLAVLAVFSFLFLVIFDICRIFAVREETKKASDAVSLAVAQNLLFFENQDCCRIAEEVAELNDCSLAKCSCGYDEVIVTVEKKVEFVFLDRFIRKSSTAASSSTARIMYPWNEQFGYCDSYMFSY
jgi:secretion/DNA translocation related TadE-like protein